VHRPRRAYDYDGAAVLRRPVRLSVYRVTAKNGGEQNEGYRAFHLVDQLRAKEFRTSAARPIKHYLTQVRKWICCIGGAKIVRHPR
jgi:hypothetical protein